VIAPFGASKLLDKKTGKTSWSITVNIRDENQLQALKALDSYFNEQLKANTKFFGLEDEFLYSGKLLKREKKSEDGTKTYPPTMRFDIPCDEMGPRTKFIGLDSQSESWQFTRCCVSILFQPHHITVKGGNQVSWKLIAHKVKQQQMPALDSDVTMYTDMDF
jgi:hypothetical protein